MRAHTHARIQFFFPRAEKGELCTLGPPSTTTRLIIPRSIPAPRTMPPASSSVPCQGRGGGQKEERGSQKVRPHSFSAHLQCLNEGAKRKEEEKAKGPCARCRCCLPCPPNPPHQPLPLPPRIHTTLTPPALCPQSLSSPPPAPLSAPQPWLPTDLAEEHAAREAVLEGVHVHLGEAAQRARIFPPGDLTGAHCKNVVPAIGSARSTFFLHQHLIRETVLVAWRRTIRAAAAGPDLEMWTNWCWGSERSLP